MSEDSPSEEDLEYAQSCIYTSMSRISNVQSELSAVNATDQELGEEELREIMMEIKLERVLVDCQYVIELSVKSMFKMVGKDFPKQHGIGLSSGRTHDMLTSVGDDFEYKNMIPRAVFLTKFWSEFYELSKYGAPQLNQSTNDIFHIKDVRRIVEDAEFCLDLSRFLLDYVVDKYNMEHPHPDNDEVNFHLSTDPYHLEYEE